MVLVRAPLLLVLGVVLASCHSAGILDPEGPVSAAERLILFNATGIMLVVVAPVIVMTLAFAWWFRASNTRAKYLPEWDYSGQIELVVWAIPAMIVLLLAGVTWIGSHQLDPGAPLDSRMKPLRIEVVSLDWKWLFIYPDARVATVNELVVPVGTPIEFLLTSATVMNAFFVPQLGSQIYTMPGMTTRLNLQADRRGDFPGLSSHFSGDGFSDMRFMVHAQPPALYEEWLAHARRAVPLTDQAYAQLARTSTNDTPRSYGDVDPLLYHRILQQTAARAAASAEEH